MHQRLLLLLMLTCLAHLLAAQKLYVSPNSRFLMTADGNPFFWLADTAWELFHRCDREEAEMYLQTRARQGFTVIQAVALAEIDGLNVPNPYGERPLHENDPQRPNEAYFEHVDGIIRKADELGLYIALLPTWGDKVNPKSWGVGPVVFTPENARTFGSWLGKRYKEQENLIWIIGGDRNPREHSDDVAIWNAMAEGIAEAAGGYEETLMSFHPQPTPAGTGGSSTWFHHQPWLDFNMHQTGHCANKPTYQHIAHDYQLEPVKPVLDGEPLYEDHPNCFNAKELGHSVPEDIRRIMYWNVFAGGFGQTYGCHAVWQMYVPGRDPINQPLRPWKKALELPMANQAQHLKHLMLSRPFFSRIPDSSLVISPQKDDETHVIATRDRDGSYAMVFFPTGTPTMLDLGTLSGQTLRSWWYDPRTGAAFEGETFEKTAQRWVTPPSSGKGQDWVLVLDDAAQGFQAPGTTR